MRVLVIHESDRVRARLDRLSDDLRVVRMTVVEGTAEAIDQAAAQASDLVLISGASAQRRPSDIARLVDDRARGPVVVIGTGMEADATADSLLDPSVDPDAPASSVDAILELGRIFRALAAQPPGNPTDRGLQGGTVPARRTGTERITREELSDAEDQVLRGLAIGATTGQVAQAMGISEALVEGHLAAVIDKLHGRADPSTRGSGVKLTRAR